MATKGKSKILDTAVEIQLKYTADLKTLEKELGVLNKALSNARKKNAKGSEKLTHEEYDNISKVAVAKTQEIEKLKHKIKQSYVQLNSKLAEEEEKRRADIQKRWNARRRAMNKNAAKQRAQDEINEAKKGVNGYVSRWRKAFDTISRYFSAYQVVNLAIGGVRDIITDFTEIERTLSKVSVIVGKSKKEVLGLRNEIYNVASAFGISAKEGAKFAFQMSKLGKTQSEIGVLSKQAATLSVILGEDMATAGTAIVTTMNQFNLTVSEASQVTTAFFKAIKESPLSVRDLQTALQYVGTAANAAGLSVIETASAMEYLSERGLRASKVGTGLRNVILKLSGDGRNLKDVLAEMSQEGITLADALDLFGKRGAIAGYTLINEWDKIADSFTYDIPTAIETTLETLRGTDNVLDNLAKSWNRLKRSIFGDSQSDQELNLLTDIQFAAGMLKTDLVDVGKNIREALSAGTLLDGDNILEVALGKETVDKIGVLTSNLPGLTRFVDELKVGLLGLRDVMNGELIDRKQLDAIVGAFDRQVATLQEAMRVGLDSNTARESLLKIKNEIIAGLEDAGFGTEEALEKWEKLFQDGVQRVITVDKLINIDELKKKVADANAEVARLQNEFTSNKANTAILPDLKDAQKKQKELCELSKLFGLELVGCVKEKSGRKIDSELKDNAKLLERLFADNIATIDLDAAVRDANIKDISDETQKRLRDMLTFKQFSDKIKSEDGKATKKEILEQYKAYTTDFTDTLFQDIVAITDEAISSVDLVGEQKGGQVNWIIEAFKSLLGGAKTEEEIAYLEGLIQKYETLGTKIETVIVKDVDNLADESQKAKDNINSKRLDIASLIEGLILGDDNKSLEDKLQYISDMLGEVVDIYTEFAEEMQNQLQERLDREKEGIENRYAFEKDQIRLAAENNLMTQEAYGARSLQLEKDRLRKVNAIERAQFESKKKHDKKMAVVDGIAQGAEAFIKTFVANAANPVLGAILGAVSAAIVGAQVGVKVNAINQRQFTPIQFEKGGMIVGDSHADGGVPFTVNGRAGFEAEGGEYIVNKTAVNPATLPILEAINGNKPYNSHYFATGGGVPDVSEGQDVAENANVNKTYNITRAVISNKDLDAWERNKIYRDSQKSLLG